MNAIEIDFYIIHFSLGKIFDHNHYFRDNSNVLVDQSEEKLSLMSLF